MAHWVDVEIPALGSPISHFGHSRGISGYCNKLHRAQIVSSKNQTDKEATHQPLHGVTTIFRSHLGTRVGATVPATIPLAPCDELGMNPIIPVNWNNMRVDVDPEGMASSAFESASAFPYHYLYENRKLKKVNGKPYRPAVDYESWATSTGAKLWQVNAGFHAVGLACCNNGALPRCASLCAGGKSYPVATVENVVNCADVALECISGCGSKKTKCAKAGTDCSASDLKKAANP